MFLFFFWFGCFVFVVVVVVVDVKLLTSVHELTNSSVHLGAEVYERLNSHREEQKGNRRMLDDILIHVQVVVLE